jgi:hypothetical protein
MYELLDEATLLFMVQNGFKCAHQDKPDEFIKEYSDEDYNKYFKCKLCNEKFKENPVLLEDLR